MGNKGKVYDYQHMKLAYNVTYRPVYFAMRARKAGLISLFHALLTGRIDLTGTLRVEPYKEDLVLSVLRFFRKEMCDGDNDLMSESGNGADYTWRYRGRLLLTFSNNSSRFIIHSATWQLFRKEALAWLRINTPQGMSLASLGE